MPEETKPGIPILSTPAEVDAVIEQAAREGWTSLGLRFRHRYALRPTHPFPHAFWTVTELSFEQTARVAKLTGLTQLDIAGNSIGETGAADIAKLTRLTQLDITNNNIGDPGAADIAKLTGLTQLDITNNSIGDPGAADIAKLTGLTRLDIAGNSIGETGAAEIAKLNGLTQLGIFNNSIEETGAAEIAKLTGLAQLDIGYNRIGETGAAEIAKLTGLTQLDIDFNGIGETGAADIAQITGLTQLDISINGIGESGAAEIAKLTGLTRLGITANRIGETGAAEIAKLTGLIQLSTGGNSIGETGAAEIAKITGLTQLDIGGNGIGETGAAEIAKITGLTQLDIADNSIGETGAAEIAKLTGLTQLDIADNSIGETGAAGIAKLTGLTQLDIGGNGISETGAAGIAKLTGLTQLDIADNSIGETGARAILDSWASRKGKTSPTSLDLRDSGDLSALLPKEALDTQDAQAILAAYRRFQNDRLTGQLRPLNEAKLIVVGDEAVGKTSLIRFLIDGVPRNPDERKTPGVKQRRVETEQWSCGTSDILLNVWDFGGQQIMHGTHRYFLTKRSLYLLVLEDRRQDDLSVHDWLRTIRSRGDDSPVIVIINKSDDGKADLRLDETDLKSKHGVRHILRTACNDDDHSRESIETLRETIVGILEGDPVLRHIRDDFPDGWRRVKETVSEMAAEERVLVVRSFLNVCEDTAASAKAGCNPVTDAAEQRSLLRLLHELGVVVAHGLEDDSPAVTREVALLDPNWLTDAIYTILNSGLIRDQEGELRRDQLPLLLDPEVYPADHHEFILGMMQDPDIGLAFALPQTNGQAFLIPEALPSSEPEYQNIWPTDSLCFRYRYDPLPSGLMPRFIVEAHQLLSPSPTRWRTGVVLQVDGHMALVKADPASRKIDIRIQGEAGRTRNAALSMVRNHLETVNGFYEELGTKPCVPFPDASHEDKPYEHLLKLEAKFGPEHPVCSESGTESYTVKQLLDGVGSNRPSPVKPSVPEPEQEGRNRAPWEFVLLVVTMVLAFAGFVGVCVWAAGKTEPAITALIIGVAVVLLVFVGSLGLRWFKLISARAMETVVKKAMSAGSSLLSRGKDKTTDGK